MSDWLKFSILWGLTGSPLTAGLVMLALYAVADWYTVGFLRRFWRMFQNARRGARLEGVIGHNPHDRKARADLGEILVEQRRYARAVEVLKPVLDADATDKNALYLLGVACFGAGKVEQGELFLSTVLELEPDFRHGDAQLALGRMRLEKGNAKGAVEALLAFLKLHPGSIQGHYHLWRAYQATGEAQPAAEAKQRTWHEYTTALPYEQRRDRLYAWRVKPERPVLYGLIAAALLGLVAKAMGSADLSSMRRGYGYGAQVDEEQMEQARQQAIQTLQQQSEQYQKTHAAQPQPSAPQATENAEQ